MKKIFNFVLLLLVSVLTLGVACGNSITAYAVIAGEYLVMTFSLPRNVDISDGFAIPYEVNSSGVLAGTIKIRVTLPNGVVRVFDTTNLDDSQDDYLNSDNKYFTVNTIDKTISLKSIVPGDYRVEYLSVVGSVAIVTQSSVVTVTQDVYTMKLSNTIIPSVINPDVKISLPTATVYDEDEEEVDDLAAAGVTVTMKVTKATNTGDVDVDLTEEDGVKSFTPSEVGSYTTTISLLVGGIATDTKTYKTTVKSTDDFNPEEDITLTNPTFNFSFPTSSNVYMNEEFSLPTASVSNSQTDETVEAYVKVEVKAPSANEWAEVEDYKYTPTETGTYQFRYSFTDFYGNELGPVSQSLTVTDHRAPKVLMVKEYDAETATLDNVVEDYVNLKSNSGVGSYEKLAAYTDANNDQVGIYFPAIYAYDEVDGTDLTLSRTFKYNGHVFNIDEYQKSILGEVDYSKPVYFKFTSTEYANSNWVKDGAEYTVIYSASDKGTGRTNSATNTATFQLNNSQPTFVLYKQDAYLDTKAPVINDFNVDAEIYPTDTISFSMPTIVDYNADDETKVDDTRIEKHVAWFVGTSDDVTTSRNVATNEVSYLRSNVAIESTELEIKDDKIEFTLPDNFNVGANPNITVAVYAVDDNGNESVVYKTIKVINTSDAVEPIVLNDLDTAFAPFNSDVDSNVEVTLPTITFFDQDSDNLKVTVNVYDPNGESVSAYDGNYIFTKNAQNNTDTGIKVEVTGFKFTTTIAGTYTVVYTATDAGGNSKVVGSYIVCDPVVIPTIAGIGDTKVTMQLGSTMYIPDAVVYANGVKVDATSSFVITSNKSFDQDGNRFTPREKGTYTVTYSARYNDHDAETVVKTITVIDSTAPVIEVSGAVQATAQLDELIYLPDFRITEAGGIKSSGVKITSSASSKEIEAEYTVVSGVGYWTFTPTLNGTYTVVYYATDMSGNASVETENVTKFAIKAGDVTPPTITVGDGAITRTGDTLKIDTSLITVRDVNYANETIDLDSGDIELVLTYEGSSEVISGTKDGTITTYELENPGKYTLTISIDDDADLTGQKVFNYTVTAASEDAGISDDVLGSILIIASLLLLGGVIVYFIVTDKRAPKNKK